MSLRARSPRRRVSRSGWRCWPPRSACTSRCAPTCRARSTRDCASVREAFVGPAGAGAGGVGTPPPDEGLPAGGPRQGGLPSRVQPAPFGAPSGYVQFISPQGTVDVPAGQGASPPIPVSAHDRRIARRGSGSALSDRTVGHEAAGAHARDRRGWRGADRAAAHRNQPRAEPDPAAARDRGVCGIALAAILGALVARIALAPVARFTAARRRSPATSTCRGVWRYRAATSWRGWRAASTDLDALERSIEAQRQLIADAGHELRTPIASLRANIQVLGEAERLPPRTGEPAPGHHR